MQPQAANLIDHAGFPVIRIEPRNGRDFTLPCGSYSGPRWYCATTGPGREALAQDRLAHLGFAAFLPLVAREVRHARRVAVVMRPMFPRYVFVRFDVAADPWRRAYAARCVRIFGATPERPAPLPAGLVERWQAEGLDRPIMRDVAPDLIAAGAEVTLSAGPFADHRGVCLWDDGQRVRVLLSLLGGQVPASVPRGQVVRA
jgi:transcription antitermination factor NusG